MTSTLIYNQDARLVPWVAERTGGGTFRPDATAIGLERDGELVAAVVFDGFSKADCNMHVASDGSKRWLSRGFLAAVFAYPFTQLGLRRVTALVPASNTVALEFDKGLGFVQEGYHPHGLPDDDLVTLGMLRGACRYLPDNLRTTEGET